MIGSPARHESRAAASRSRPSERAAEIVAPFRETPGTRAEAWEKPTASSTEDGNLPRLEGQAPLSVAIGGPGPLFVVAETLVSRPSAAISAQPAAICAIAATRGFDAFCSMRSS